MIDERNEYGFPVVHADLERARQYAAEARERNKPACQCQTCRLQELEPAVMNITQNWKQS